MTAVSPTLRRRTKIIATLGPASDGALRMEDLLRSGVDVFRLNFSHGTHAEHAKIASPPRAKRKRRSAGRSACLPTCRARSCASATCPAA